MSDRVVWTLGVVTYDCTRTPAGTLFVTVGTRADLDHGHGDGQLIEYTNTRDLGEYRWTGYIANRDEEPDVFAVNVKSVIDMLDATDKVLR